MKLLKWLFGSRKPALNKPVVVGSSSPKKEQTYMHIEEGTGRLYFTNEPPHIKKWCEEQLQKSRSRCRC